MPISKKNCLGYLFPFLIPSKNVWQRYEYLERMPDCE